MRYKYILFDLDGTLTDPKVGITKSVAYALEKMGIANVAINDLLKFIGPPLKESFMEYYGFNETEAFQAISFYRERFKAKGLYENELYTGIDDLLGTLKESGCILAVATSKPTVFAEQILKHFHLDEYFSHVVGSNLDHTRTDKAEVIQYVLSQLKVENLGEVVMVGDREHDIIGANKSVLHSIGVEYGYGSYDEFIKSGATYIVKTVDELKSLLIS